MHLSRNLMFSSSLLLLLFLLLLIIVMIYVCYVHNDQSVYFSFRLINTNSNTPSLFTEKNQPGMRLPTAWFVEAIELKLVVHLNIIKN